MSSLVSNSKDIEKKIQELESYAENVLGKINGVTKERPLFIEFAGTPKAGKTTAVNCLRLFLRRNGFNVHVLSERASNCPIDKMDLVSFNTWTMCSGLVQIMEAIAREYQIVILDRGIFDAMCWMHWLEMRGDITKLEKDKLQQFLLLDKWCPLIDIVFLMKSTPEIALRREYAYMLTRKRGRAMNQETLEQIGKAFEETHRTFHSRFKRVLKMDTTDETQEQTGEHIVKQALKTLDEFLTIE